MLNMLKWYILYYTNAVEVRTYLNNYSERRKSGTKVVVKQYCAFTKRVLSRNKFCIEDKENNVL